MREEIKYNFYEKMVICLISVIVGIVLTTVCIFGASAFCLATDMSDSYSTLIAGICLGAGALVSGYLSGKKIKHSGLLNGMICGALIYLVVFIFSLFLSDNSFTVVSLSHFLVSVVSAGIGGILGVNATSKRKLI